MFNITGTLWLVCRITFRR